MTAEVAFRRARQDDVGAILALLADDYLGAKRESLGSPLDPRYLAAFEAIDADSNQHLLVAERGGRIVGCVQLTFIPGLSRIGMRRGLIEGVRIAADQRGTGLGTQLIGEALAICRARGCGVAQLATDKSRTDAQRFYARLGFVASHVGMKLELA